MEKIKIDFAYAHEVCRDAFENKQLYINGIACHQEIIDFRNGEKLGLHFEILAREAKKHLGKNFRAVCRLDDFHYFYEMIDLETGEVLSSLQTLRGVEPAGEFECFVFTVPELNVKVDDPKVDLENMYKRPNKITVKQKMLFFAPPKRHLFIRG